MGSNTSKSGNETAVHQSQKNDIDLACNPDPRSPTPEIIRTPLQGKTGGKHNITKNVDLRKTFETAMGEEKLIHNNPILSAVIKNHLQSYDPRSPTQDFERTPIVIPSKIDKLSNEDDLLNGSTCHKNDDQGNNDSCLETMDTNVLIPKNLCDGFYDMTLNETLKESDEPLGSSTASNEAIDSNLSVEKGDKKTQLLETNFEYIESDNDKFEDSEENIQHVDDCDNTDGEIKEILQFEILDDDPRSPSIGIERTPIVVAKVEDSGDVNVEKMSDDTLIKVLQCTNTELRQTARPQENKNDGVLIYEDGTDSQSDTPRKSKSTNGARTPLSCMRNKADAGLSKSTNTLYDPKSQVISSKLQRRVSHIPRLKSLSKTKLTPTGSSVSLKNITKTSAISGDCENTPPHSHRDRWDKDNSIIL